MGLSKSNTGRTRFETQTFTSSVRSVHELRQERSRAPSGAFNVHEFQFPSGTFTNPDGAYETSIRYVVLLHCIRTLRTGFESLRLVSKLFKEIFL